MSLKLRIEYTLVCLCVVAVRSVRYILKKLQYEKHASIPPHSAYGHLLDIPYRDIHGHPIIQPAPEVRPDEPLPRKYERVDDQG